MDAFRLRADCQLHGEPNLFWEDMDEMENVARDFTAQVPAPKVKTEIATSSRERREIYGTRTGRKLSVSAGRFSPNYSEKRTHLLQVFERIVCGNDLCRKNRTRFAAVVFSSSTTAFSPMSWVSRAGGCRWGGRVSRLRGPVAPGHRPPHGPQRTSGRCRAGHATSLLSRPSPA